MAVIKRGPGKTQKLRRKTVLGTTVGLVTEGSANIALAAGTLGEVLARKGGAAGLLRSYGKALRDAERFGHPVRMTVLIDPKRESPKVAIEAVREQPADALDRALDDARARGALRAAEILNRAEMLTADQFAEVIGASRETVHQKRRRGEVLGLEGPKRGVRFPEWQLSANGELLPGLPQLYDALGDRPWAIYRFLLQHHPELDGKTALEALRGGRIDAVVAAAENVGKGVFA